mmetsp:Transcript_18094/g.32867  ORF Transcript_18094/g.32867 Transcript_18094/m.32867 type:complete len:207 (-) Transcript_18094:70-690(-)|eukprot:CAMPEP_0205927860 /NCGR_PEP_ID=MMETSP1325-20131115/23503_1 /ASSEMBLY_ACC=CAM_ASM_000708 /TAXON_ID=236786 /ORGANISM="Florenciella sp., Strain RCC1007" /LENGTH=206 /DNA_ID=CAMNT_0053296807 /DNA_START=204 /DNA_END=820 /DNA_ORIENTATION=-
MGLVSFFFPADTNAVSVSYSTAESDADRSAYFAVALWVTLGGGGVMALLYGIMGTLMLCTIIFRDCGRDVLNLGLVALCPFGKNIPRDGGCEQGIHIRCVGSYVVYWPLGLTLALVHFAMALLCLVVVDSWQCCARALFGRLPLGLDIFFAKEHLLLAIAAMAPFSSTNFEDARGGIYQRKAAAAPMAEPFIRVSEMSLGGGFNFA